MRVPFVGRPVYRLDAKGRVAVPANIRKAVAQDPDPGVVLFPDTDPDAEFMHGSGVEGFRAIVAAFGLPLPGKPGSQRDAGPGAQTQGTARANPFAKRNKILGRGQWSIAEFLPFDKEGRVLLPGTVIHRCGLDGSVCFVGCDETFQIWNPQRLEAADKADEVALGQYRTMIEAFDPWQVDADMPDAAEVGK